jgi:mRNA interferase RelE/StbE
VSAPRRYRVELARSAAKELDRLPERDFGAVARRIDQLAEEPRPHGAAKLKGRAEYKLRVGRLRVVYEVDDGARSVRVLLVDDRKQGYRRLRKR